MDGVSSLWCNIHGNTGTPALDAPSAPQLDKIATIHALGDHSSDGDRAGSSWWTRPPAALTRVLLDDGADPPSRSRSRCLPVLAARSRKPPTRAAAKRFMALGGAYHGAHARRGERRRRRTVPSDCSGRLLFPVPPRTSPTATMPALARGEDCGIACLREVDADPGRTPGRGVGSLRSSSSR